MRRVIISGGGTGGHIYPAITIARAIADIEPTEFLYVGSKIGLENTLIPNEGIPFVTIDVRGLERKISFRNLVTLGKTAGSLIKAEHIIHKFKPDVVIGTGGFVCGPVLLAASLSGIPTLVQEQNVIPGVTNTILSRFVKCVALGYEEAAERFKRKDILVYTGNPVRKDILLSPIVADQSLNSAMHHRLGEPLPHQLTNAPRDHLLVIAEPSFK